ncbi:MAG: hypothetical protein JW839_11810 [Candidatus Lokiarchaeota archaeon]|nr:hypothetical protein [Candidatus Lokiarchaeota archaeon]
MVTSDYKKLDMSRSCLAFIGFFISVIIAMGIYGLVAFGNDYPPRDQLINIFVLGCLGFVAFLLFSKSREYHKKIKAYKKGE